MTIQPNGAGGYIVTQKLTKPVIYLDHWAVRMFSEDEMLQKQFVAALHRASGTWLFSQLNLFEFVAMTDFEQAAAAEALLKRVLPNLHVADMSIDRGYLLEKGAPPHPDAPDENWILKDLGARAQIAGGAWNTHDFLTDCITHRKELLPLLDQLKQSSVDALKAMTEDSTKVALAKKFTPTAGMDARDALAKELLREPMLNDKFKFDGHHAMDLLHTLGSAMVCDYALLDGGWRHKLESASKRLRDGGVVGSLPKAYDKKMVPDFLSNLEAVSHQAA